MKKIGLFSKSAIMTVAAASMAVAGIAEACTGIALTGADGTPVRARTMEWGAFDLEASVTLVPRGYEMASKMPDGSDGASWKGKYGFVAATGLGRLLTTDGVNETGLSGGLFYLPGFADYPAFDPAQRGNSISPTDVMSYILANYSTVAEVREAMDTIRIVSVSEPALGFPAPVHYFVSDPSGAAIVIEVVNKEMKVYDAPLGVITNSPSYDWHLTNLRNYLNLSATALPTKTVAETDFAPLGSGSGMIGLPGDFTPPSRFVRAVAFTQSARETTGGYDTVREAFRILDNFNVPAHGVQHDEGSDHEGGLVLSSTQFTNAVDMEKKLFYYHTQHNRRVRVIDLNTIDFGSIGNEPIMLPMDTERVEDIKAVSFKR
ncbi:MAG: choloylglycine hydrolase family protein [Pseudomonadota bacterium]